MINLALDYFMSNIFLVSLVESYPSDFINMIITTLSKEDFQNLFPPFPDDLKLIEKTLENKLYHIMKNHFPPQMQKLTKLMCHSSFFAINSRLFILEHLLSTGILKPLKKHQKKTVNMILFADVLPKVIDN